MALKWKKEYATGDIEIDRQHQNMFQHLDDLLIAVETGKGQAALADIFDFLENYTLKHFAAEEGLQREYNYPHISMHCDEHKIFLHNLERLKLRIATDGKSDSVVKLTRNTLVNWLITHICSTDKRFGDFLKTEVKSRIEERQRDLF